MIILFSFSCNSSVSRLPCFLWSFVEQLLFRNRLTHLFTLTNLFQFENVFGFVTLLIVWLEKSTLFDVPAFFSSDFASSGASKTFGGYVSFSVFRKLGPFYQAVFFARSYTVGPLVSRSTIFIFVGIYLHWLGQTVWVYQTIVICNK